MNDKLKAALSGNLDEYKSVPFWSWNNHLDEAELVKQIEEMKSAGIGGFIMHARTGLKDEYLGEKWFSCIKACLDKARELKMEAWIYDENGWPSGFVGGKLLENEAFRARFLEHFVGDFDKTAFASYIETKDGYKRVTEKVAGEDKYHNVYLRVSPANTDILNPAVTEAFINETHEKYYERFKDSFGRELVGFFTDEPQYYRWGTAYTPCVEKSFADRGEDVRDGLIWLFVHDERGYAFRQKYFKEMNRLYVENFYKKIYEWCGAHNCKLTGHSVEENKLGTQMWGGADVMPTYEEEHIPAIDFLGRCCATELASKQLGSVASQLGKKLALTETFACSGNDVTPKELKSVGDLQYFNGVSKMCQHLYPYSMARGGKTDHPPVFSPHGNWFKGFKEFNDYFTRLGYIISNTEENCDIAVISPLRDVWSEFVKADDVNGVKDIDDRFTSLLVELRKHGVTFQLIDETILKKHGKNENGALVVGKRKYKTVLVPEMKNIGAETLSLLKQFNGKLCVLGKPQYIDGIKSETELNGNETFENIIKNAEIGFTCDDANTFVTSRSGETGDFLFVKNLAYAAESTVKIKGISEKYRKLDLVTLTESDITDEIKLGYGEGIILIKSENAKTAAEKTVELCVTDKFAVTDITKNYLVADYGRISKDGEKYGDYRPIYGLFEDLLREDYKGKLFVKQTFTVKEKTSVTLVMEKAEFLSLELNGQPVKLSRGDFDVYFCEADISDKIKIGENELIYSIDFYEHDGVNFALFDPLATESLRNCLYYDTSIEPVYLKGEFVVGKNMALYAKKELPAVTDKLYENGYPFFKGTIKYKGVIEKPKTGRAILDLKGRFMTAEVKTEKGEKLFVLDTEGDITDLLKDGENEVEIMLNSSLRNLFGPHHFKPEAEPLGVSPYNFEFRGFWKDGKNPKDYTDEYNFVPFGLKDIIIKNII